ncbi:hypothetical protein TNIN_297361 [Trichonephila inaurata madagascariensis]|uniref:Uncharacterized protein n=1 Tax=Trichonephila inaurata madagascariensis TaxID=2747483 RepID=A0A8X6X4J0_9ARAC|nr:hypothetical protein TNIN_297361 [Trichonephila inaurata madagascariensis]
MAATPNCDYLVSIKWMRFQSQWVPYRIFFASSFDNKQVEIHPTLESLQWFTYQDIVKNLKHSSSLFEDNDGWDRSDIVRVAQEELQHFLKCYLLKEYLERDNHGWALVIGATDLPTYMHLDHIIPEVMHYIGKEHQADVMVLEIMKRFNWEEQAIHV